MRLLPLAALAACTSTQMLAGTVDPSLRVPDHHAAFVVHTAERGKGRVDPATGIEFGDAHGRWSGGISAGELAVDPDGVWYDRFSHPWDAADAVRIEGLSERAAALIEKKRPFGGLVERDGDAWVLSGARSVLESWLQTLVLGIARQQPLETVEVQDDPKLPETRHVLTDDDAKLYQLRAVDRGASLGTWSFSARGGPWQVPMHGLDLVHFVEDGHRVRVGWKWSEIAHVRVTNLDGLETLGGMTLAVAATAGIFVVAGAASTLLPPDHSPPPPRWEPDLAPASSDRAERLFASGARRRWFISPMLTFDATSSYRGDVLSTGASARLHLFELFEIGGGTRVVETRSMTGARERSTTGNFQVGLHLPIDAAYHYALAFGLDVGGGGHVDFDLRLPWGVRFTQGRWLATILPATPQFVRIDGNAGRWAAAGGIELGTRF